MFDYCKDQDGPLNKIFDHKTTLLIVHEKLALWMQSSNNMSHSIALTCLHIRAQAHYQRREDQTTLKCLVPGVTLPAEEMGARSVDGRRPGRVDK